MRSDFAVMKDLAVHTRLTPEQRQREVGRLIDYIHKYACGRRAAPAPAPTGVGCGVWGVGRGVWAAQGGAVLPVPEGGVLGRGGRPWPCRCLWREKAGRSRVGLAAPSSLCTTPGLPCGEQRGRPRPQGVRTPADVWALRPQRRQRAEGAPGLGSELRLQPAVLLGESSAGGEDPPRREDSEAAPLPWGGGLGDRRAQGRLAGGCPPRPTPAPAHGRAAAEAAGRSYRGQGPVRGRSRAPRPSGAGQCSGGSFYRDPYAAVGLPGHSRISSPTCSPPSASVRHCSPGARRRPGGQRQLPGPSRGARARHRASRLSPSSSTTPSSPTGPRRRGGRR